MSESRQDKQGLIQEPWLDYVCSPWRSSSQRAADLYDSGAKLWRKEDLVDIEQQLAKSLTVEKFTVRRIDNSLVHIQNPMFGVRKPIWKPRIKFQEDWHLVASKPDGPPETYHCTYLADWVNEAERNYLGLIENARFLFDVKQEQWDVSMTCKAFTSQFRQLLEGGGKARNVTKIICFGLGDMHLKVPDWWRIQNEALPKDQRQLETSEVEGAFVHHALALTMASVARSGADPEGSGVRLLTQDPGYCRETREIVRDLGFEVVGIYGAGGFTEVDSESIVFSAYAKAPVKQMIADLARPVAIISAGNTTGGVWNARGKPWADPESPRTRQLWEGYKSWAFPVSSDYSQIGGSLKGLMGYSRVHDTP